MAKKKIKEVLPVETDNTNPAVEIKEELPVELDNTTPAVELKTVDNFTVTIEGKEFTFNNKVKNGVKVYALIRKSSMKFFGNVSEKALIINGTIYAKNNHIVEITETSAKLIEIKKK